MSITTYAELQTAIADYLARSDITSAISDFIKMAEARMNRSLRTHDMEASATVTMTSGSGSLPSDYLEWIAVTHDGSTYDSELRYVEADSDEWRFRHRPNSNPQLFTILANTLKIRPVVSGNCTLFYYQSIPSLATNSTNWLLTQAPDLYLNYALAEAHIYIKQYDRAKDFMALAEGNLSKAVAGGDSNKMARRASRNVAIENTAAAENPQTDGY